MTKQHKFPNDASEFVYVRTYSRWIEDQNRRETWPETVDRFVRFITEERGDKIPAKVLKKIRKYVLGMEVMPSMRFLWAAGPAAKAQNLCIYNCSFRAVDSIEAFSEALYVLCCGTGFGFSVEEKYTQKLPAIPTISSDGAGVHVVQDSKEGWAESAKALITSLYAGKDLDMDYSLVRPKGSRLKTMGGRASGPAPLITLHSYIREAFGKAQGRKFTSLECHDIMCQIAEIVVVGGVRRSSLISLSDLNSEELRHAKDHPFPPRRYMSNNSAAYYEKPSAVEFLREWSALAASGTGERGIFNLGGARQSMPERRDKELIAGTNPCVTGDTCILTKDGYKEIQTLVDIPVEVWNGYEWSVVTPKITGENMPILEIKTRRGSTIKCTAYHKFYLAGPYKGQQRQTVSYTNANQLKVGDQLIEWVIPNGEDIIQDTVTSIRELGVEKFVYCFNEPKNHTAIFNGIITGQCGEILLRNQGLCNLSEVVVRNEDDADTLLDKIETATWLGVIQATFTDFPYLSEGWANNANEERLLGVSLTGQFDNASLLSASILKAGKAKALKVAKHASDVMGIPMPAAVTCVKPSGSVSQLTDSASGLHPRYSKYYIRRYRIAAVDPLLKMLKAQGIPMSPENDQTEANANTWVVSFPVKAPPHAKTRHDMTAIDQLEWYKKVMKYWCEHNASMTVYVKDSEWLEVGNWVYQNWDIINGVSFLPYDSGHYQQAPYEEITKDEYEKMVKTLKSIDYTQLGQFETEDNTEGAKSYSCTGDKCELV